MRVTRSRGLVAEGYRPAAVARVAQVSRPGDLPHPEAAAGAGRAGTSAGGRGRGGDRRRGRGQPDRRLPDGLRLGAAAARAPGQPQAGAARDARAPAHPAPPPTAATPAAGVLPRQAPRSALASGHDLSLGRRARLGLPDGRDRLLHTRDRRLASGDRCRAKEAIGLIERAAAERGIPPGTLTLGTDNGSAFTARAFKAVLATLGIAHRRGGYRDPESQAFIESWFGKLKERCVWREEFETLDH